MFQAGARLQQAAAAAVSTLLKIMIDGSAPPGVRTRAAQSLLEWGKEVLHNEDFEVRLFGHIGGSRRTLAQSGGNFTELLKG